MVYMTCSEPSELEKVLSLMPTGRGKIFTTVRRSGVLVATSLTLAIGQLAGLLDTPAFAQGGAADGALLSQVSAPLPTSRFTAPSNIIIPTDVLPLPAAQDRMTVGENFQLRLLQKLPAKFYATAACETTFRFETNPFQFPTKRKLLSQLPPPPVFRQLNAFQQRDIYSILGLTGNRDMIFRVLPNVTGGWAISPRWRLFTNFFTIRDSLFENVQLNTNIYSYAWGMQRDFPLGSRAQMQVEFQFRNLNQKHQKSFFDYLPGVTFSYIINPRTVLFGNALIQMRGRKYFQAPTVEFDPFYTIGLLYQRSGWTFSASTTFVQNFRNQFKARATIPTNNYVSISDIEISRRVTKKVPGLQAFTRIEPIFNGHSHNKPGLAGMDFRLFYGLRMAAAKPALTQSMQIIREQLKEQNEAPPSQKDPPIKKPPLNKPSAFILPYQVISRNSQPIHGLLSDSPDVVGQAIPSDGLLIPVLSRAYEDANAVPGQIMLGQDSGAPIGIGLGQDAPGQDDWIANLYKSKLTLSKVVATANKSIAAVARVPALEVAYTGERLQALSSQMNYDMTAEHTAMVAPKPVGEVEPIAAGGAAELLTARLDPSSFAVLDAIASGGSVAETGELKAQLPVRDYESGAVAQSDGAKNLAQSWEDQTGTSLNWSAIEQKCDVLAIDSILSDYQILADVEMAEAATTVESYAQTAERTQMLAVSPSPRTAQAPLSKPVAVPAPPLRAPAAKPLSAPSGLPPAASTVAPSPSANLAAAGTKTMSSAKGAAPTAVQSAVAARVSAVPSASGSSHLSRLVATAVIAPSDQLTQLTDASLRGIALGSRYFDGIRDVINRGAIVSARPLQAPEVVPSKASAIAEAEPQSLP